MKFTPFPSRSGIVPLVQWMRSTIGARNDGGEAETGVGTGGGRAFCRRGGAASSVGQCAALTQSFQGTDQLPLGHRRGGPPV